jgi:hypothetical protein
MKTIELKLYQFDELEEGAKQTAIEKLFDINVDHQWWDAVYYDAENAGIKITGFDIDRGNFIEGDPINGILEIAEKVTKEHGEHCETFLTASNFMKERDELVKKYSDGKNLEIVTEDNEYNFDQDCDELENEFFKSILEDYLIMLRKDFEYLTSEEAIIETIRANEYDFTEDGKLY